MVEICKFCGDEFNNSNSLMGHMLRVHNNEKEKFSNFIRQPSNVETNVNIERSNVQRRIAELNKIRELQSVKMRSGVDRLRDEFEETKLKEKIRKLQVQIKKDKDSDEAQLKKNRSKEFDEQLKETFPNVHLSEEEKMEKKVEEKILERLDDIEEAVFEEADDDEEDEEE